MSWTVKLDHVAIGAQRIDDARPFAEGVLGGVAQGGHPEGAFRWEQWRFAGGGVLEFLEPYGPPGGFLHRFLEQRGPGFHHATFKVPSLEAAIARARELGLSPVNTNASHPDWKETFLHPKEAMGIVVQMAESRDEGWAPPAPPETAARVLALRLVARDAARARRQWGELLAGREEPAPGGLRFRWPDSPIAIHVDLDPDAPAEGPRWLELACPRRLALPPGPHPHLGATFRQVAFGDGA